MSATKYLWRKRLPVIVGIVGGSGAGKTWLANQLIRNCRKEACLISLDDFYRDRSHLSPARRQKINFDHPRCIDWARLETTLRSCIVGKRTTMPSYDFATHSRREKEKPLLPKPLVLVEGLWLLRRPSVRRLFSYTIFVECPGELRLQRRLHRDCAERGRTKVSVRDQFRSCVAPMHERFVAPQQRWADRVFDHAPNRDEIKQLVTTMESLIS
ncbi:MAG: uridine kinase [Verrucomicrobia bacterium]|nr:uridine kinase [Verrucomicrobiota bacterium]